MTVRENRNLFQNFREDHGTDDGSGRGSGKRGGEEAEEEAVTGLSVRQFEESQLVGLQILLL